MVLTTCLICHRLIVRVKAAFTQSLLLKTLRIRFNAEMTKADDVTSKDAKDGKVKGKPKAEEKYGQSKVGKINNLFSSDLETLVNARYVLNTLQLIKRSINGTIAVTSFFS